MGEKYVAKEFGRIKLEYVIEDQQYVKETLADLSKAFKRSSKFFLLFPASFGVRAIIAPTRKEFDRLAVDLLKVKAAGAPRPDRLAATKDTNLLFLSPRAWEAGVDEYTPERYKALIHHEMMHLFERKLAPSTARMPLWWSEGLAIYIAKQWEIEPDWLREISEAIKADKCPSLKDLEDCESADDLRRCIVWGWTVIAYLDVAIGKDIVRQTVLECADGDIMKFVPGGATRFEEKWHRWFERWTGAKVNRTLDKNED